MSILIAFAWKRSLWFGTRAAAKTHFHKMANEYEPEPMKWNAVRTQRPWDMMEMSKIPELTEIYFERRDNNPLQIANPTQKSGHSAANISL